MAQVAQDALEPGVHRRFAAKPARRFQRLKKRFLDQVLRLGFVAAQQIRRSKQPVAMRADHFLEINRRRGVGAGIGLKFSHIVIGARRPEKVQFATTRVKHLAARRVAWDRSVADAPEPGRQRFSPGETFPCGEAPFESVSAVCAALRRCLK